MARFDEDMAEWMESMKKYPEQVRYRVLVSESAEDLEDKINQEAKDGFKLIEGSTKIRSVLMEVYCNPSLPGERRKIIYTAEMVKPLDSLPSP